MSYLKRNGVRAAYIHNAEHLEERRLILQWWADFPDTNREKAISPFEFARTSNPVQ
ncbi:Prophage integrase [Salmonella enterica subsp. enterica serovar Newport str. SHSN004]|nr:integrase [Salmonella enterica]ECM8012487.1 integrase [Salmonella enterica subsp. enterica serovar Newport]EMG72223.1 Prophage integrase [Salmonella enterica subsp. enterica serovar Newport str. Shandong_3]OSJ66141.1 Prophage integrase [Salmonella enterica subsp. enterica serovar Newport str. SHSN004]OSJ92072.1 Prophage integrase [Salmonella enterica subsp. enterica serovar Newport str. SHSN012]